MAKVKETTGIVGLDVVPNVREVLIGLYTKTLKEIQAILEDEGYRKAVESFTRNRLNKIQKTCLAIEEPATSPLKLLQKSSLIVTVAASAFHSLPCFTPHPSSRLSPLPINSPVQKLLLPSTHTCNSNMGLNTIICKDDLLDNLVAIIYPRIKSLIMEVKSFWPFYMSCIVENDAPIPKHVPYHRAPPLP